VSAIPSHHHVHTLTGRQRPSVVGRLILDALTGEPEGAQPLGEAFTETAAAGTAATERLRGNVRVLDGPRVATGYDRP